MSVSEGLATPDWSAFYGQLHRFVAMRVRDAALRVSDRQKRHIRRLFEMVNLMQEAGFAVEHSERFLATPVWGLMCVVAVNGPAPSTSA